MNKNLFLVMSLALTCLFDLVILDASKPSADPVATVHLPRRVPHGFHGSWIRD